jgi:hypothetical protein
VRRLIAQEAAEQRQSERAGIGGRLNDAKRGGGYDASRIHSDRRFFVVSGYRTVLVEIVVVTERARSCARYLVVSGVAVEIPGEGNFLVMRNFLMQKHHGESGRANIASL